MAILWLNSTALFIGLLPLLGLFTNGVFALHTIWLPEMFPTAQRSLGAGFSFSFGRLLGAVGPNIVGGLVVLTGSYPIALAAVSVIYLIGLSTSSGCRSLLWRRKRLESRFPPDSKRGCHVQRVIRDRAAASMFRQAATLSHARLGDHWNRCFRNQALQYSLRAGPWNYTEAFARRRVGK